MTTIESFLSQILLSIQGRDGNRLTEFIILNFEGLSEDRRKPFEDLHNELNARYPASKDAALSTLVKQSLPASDLQSCHIFFTDTIISYLRYVRDYPGDSALTKAQKIEKLTRQCISTLRDEQPGPIMIPLVLYLTSILRLIAINLDRDPELLDQSAQTSLSEDDLGVSFVENTGNVLREAFNKCIARSKSDVPPSTDKLDSGLYLILNSCMKLYDRAGKLRNSEYMLAALDKTSPLLSYYPAAQRVTYLYYLGKFHFTSNHFYRAVLALQAAYDQCAKHIQFVNQRRTILIHLIAASICIGRLPHQILMLDQACHNISRPFLELSLIIKSGDIGRFHTFLDYTNPTNEMAQWLLNKKVLLQLRNRCEILCWRSLIYHTMRHAGFHGSSEEGRQNSMPFVRFTAIMHAAQYSYERARQTVHQQTNGTINLAPKHDQYIDPDFADPNENDSHLYTHTHDNDNTPQSDDPDHTSALLLPLPDPSASELNSVVLSLISQGFLRGFVSHTHPDILQSRFAIPGVRRPQSTWKEVGFPDVFRVVEVQEEAWDAGIVSGDVPGWVTEGRLRRRGVVGGAGRVVRFSAKAIGS